MKKIVGGVLAILVIGTFLYVRPYYVFATKTVGISPVKMLFHTVPSSAIDNQVGILLLGIAGGNHDGPNLSDSITVLNYNFTNHTITSIGVPRDIWSSTLKEKINTAYAFGEAKQVGGGLKLAKAEISAVVGIPIQYGVVIDFSKFRQLIDYLGGLDVMVKDSFTDKDFPIEGKENDTCNGDPDFRCRYETIHFDKGMNHMDGVTALKFARSRHAAGQEGSDFGRGQRQQIIMQALKDKMIAVAKSRDIHAISGLYATLDKLIERDIDNQNGSLIAKDIALHKSTSKSYELSNALFDTPYSEEYDNKFVLVPKKGFDGLHSYVQCLLSGKTSC